MTPITSTHLALYGGLILGLAVVILLIFNGRVTGVSGILHRAVSYDHAPKAWQRLFIIGLITGGVIAHYGFNISIPELKYDNAILAIISGLLVGYGTRLGNGCTSGHGICGTSRFSKRSILSTCVFMFFGFIAVAIMRGIS